MFSEFIKPYFWICLSTLLFSNVHDGFCPNCLTSKCFMVFLSIRHWKPIRVQWNSVSQMDEDQMTRLHKINRLQIIEKGWLHHICPWNNLWKYDSSGTKIEKKNHKQLCTSRCTTSICVQLVNEVSRIIVVNWRGIQWQIINKMCSSFWIFTVQSLKKGKKLIKKIS